MKFLSTFGSVLSFVVAGDLIFVTIWSILELQFLTAFTYRKPRIINYYIFRTNRNIMYVSFLLPHMKEDERVPQWEISYKQNKSIILYCVKLKSCLFEGV